MKNNIVDQFHNLLGVENLASLETIGGVAPVIGNAITSFRIHRLSKRLESHNHKINELSQKVVSIDDDKLVELLKNFLFPSILQQLLEEDEDNKTGYFLDGFGNVIDKRIIDESKILILYDILRSLRFIEIEYLISLSRAYKNYRRDIVMNTNSQIDKPFDNEKFNPIKLAIESKLEGLGLINTGRSISYNELMRNMSKELNLTKRGLRASTRTPETTITAFGQEFLNMFSLLDKFE